MRHAVWRHARRRSYSSGWRVQNFCGKIRSIGQYSLNSCQSYPRTIKSWRRKQQQVHTILVNDNLDDLLRHYLSWLKLQRSVAWLLRFKQYLQSKVGRQTTIAAESHLTIGELDCATKEIIKVVQREPFSKELAILKREAQQPPCASQADAKVRQMNSSGRRLNDNGYVSPLRKLSPVLIDGIVCVGGRL